MLVEFLAFYNCLRDSAEFFFSSRRRHTRFKCDWSSDVCSSDLGHADRFLVKAGSGATTFGIPDSLGIPGDLAKHTLTAIYNDLESVKTLVSQYPEQIACIIVEPIAGNMGVVLPDRGFLEGLRKICDEKGILLIFDEVISGFRVAYGGAQELYGIRADMTCLGKIIGGGLPVGAYGG